MPTCDETPSSACCPGLQPCPVRSAQGVRSKCVPIAALPRAQGVRSIAFLDHMLTVGSGDGYISIWDRRAGQYLQTLSEPGGGDGDGASGPASRAGSADLAFCEADGEWAVWPRQKPFALELAGGYLEENEVYECASRGPHDCRPHAQPVVLQLPRPPTGISKLGCFHSNRRWLTACACSEGRVRPALSPCDEEQLNMLLSTFSCKLFDGSAYHRQGVGSSADDARCKGM